MIIKYTTTSTTFASWQQKTFTLSSIILLLCQLFIVNQIVQSTTTKVQAILFRHSQTEIIFTIYIFRISSYLHNLQVRKNLESSIPSPVKGSDSAFPPQAFTPKPNFKNRKTKKMRVFGLRGKPASPDLNRLDMIWFATYLPYHPFVDNHVHQNLFLLMAKQPAVYLSYLILVIHGLQNRI